MKIENFGSKSETIGEKLKRARLAKGFSIGVLADKTKIKETYINSIEKNEFYNFASRVHVQGFIRNLAKEVGLDPNYAIKIYKRDNVEIQKEKKLKNIEIKKQIKATPKKLIIFSLFISFWLFVFFLVINQIIKSNIPKLEITYPVLIESNSVTEYSIDWVGEQISISGEIDTGNRLYLNGNSIETFGLKKFEIPNLKLSNGENDFDISTKNQFGVKSEIKLKVYHSE